MIVVTGGAGFIGSNLIRGLNAAGHDRIVVVDHLRNGDKHLNLSGLRFVDYLDRDELLEQLDRLGNVQALVHQGACTSTTETDGHYMMKTNLSYSKAVLHFALRRKIPFVYASSAAVYGHGHRGFREDPECEYPLNVYAFSKLVFDNYVRSLSATESPVVGLRYFNVYGPQEHHKQRMASVAFHLFTRLERGEPVQIFEGSDELRRDFVHVDDVVKVNLFFLEQQRSGIFNCGTGRARNFMELAQIAVRCHGSGSIELTPFPADLRAKYQAFTEADVTKLQAAGYRASFLTLEQGLSSYHAALETTGGYYRSW